MAALLMGCAGSSVDQDPGGGDSSAITKGQIVAGDSPFYWADISFEAHRAALEAFGAPLGPAAAYADATDPLRAWLQALANHFDATLRAVTGNKAAPRPIMQVVRSAETFNAWSSSTFARLGTPLGDGKTSLEGESLVFSTTPHPLLSTMPLSLPTFVHPAPWTSATSFASLWNASTPDDPACALHLANGRLVPKDAACESLVKSGPDAIVQATSPFVTVSTDIAASLRDERAIAFTLAHELGHLYRAHASPLAVRKYDFWYEGGPDTTRPVPAADAAMLSQQYAALQRSRLATDDIGDALLPRNLRTLPIAIAVSTLEQLLSTSRRGIGLDGCPAFDWWLTSGGDPRVLARQLRAPGATAAFRAQYLALEQILLDCRGLRFFDGADPDRLTLRWASGVYQTAMTIGELPPIDAEFDELVIDYLVRAAVPARESERAEAAFRAQLTKRRIGFYTVEQEADEVALELMVRSGYTSQDALDGWLGTALATEAAFGPPSGDDTGQAPMATCAQWMHDGFMARGTDGKMHPVAMTVGDLSDAHHGGCYRLYNLWRASRAHAYAAVRPRFVAKVPWETVRAHAEAATQAAPLGCLGISQCRYRCEDAACDARCDARGSGDAVQRFQQIASCLDEACPRAWADLDAEAACRLDPSTGQVVDPVGCQACNTEAQASGGACADATLACLGA